MHLLLPLCLIPSGAPRFLRCGLFYFLIHLLDWNACRSRRFGEWLEPRDIFGAFGLDQ